MSPWGDSYFRHKHLLRTRGILDSSLLAVPHRRRGAEVDAHCAPNLLLLVRGQPREHLQQLGLARLADRHSVETGSLDELLQLANVPTHWQERHKPLDLGVTIEDPLRPHPAVT